MFLRRLYRAQRDHAAFDTAAQLSYYLILSLFPLLFVLAALLAYLPLGDAQAQLMDRMRALMPPAAMNLVQERVTALVTTQRPSLLGIGVLVALWAASCGVDSARKALNLAYDIKESRPFWRTQLIAIAATLISSLFILLVVGVLIASRFGGQWVAARLGIERAFGICLGIVRWPLTAALMMMGTAVAFQLLPDLKQKFTFMLPGAIAGTLLWLGATWAFTQYVGYFGSYDLTYGSIAGVVVLLTWLYISGFIFVIGGEINAIVGHAASVATTPDAREGRTDRYPPSERRTFLPPGAVEAPAVADGAPASN